MMTKQFTIVYLYIYSYINMLVGALYYKWMKWQDAYNMFEECYKYRLQILGSDHPDTILVLECVEMTKIHYSPMTQSNTTNNDSKISTIIVEPILEINIKIPLIYDTYKNIEKQEYDQVVNKVSVGLAERMKLLDFNKILLPGGPMDPRLRLLQKKVSGSSTSAEINSENEEGGGKHDSQNDNTNNENNPYTNNDKYKIILKMKNMNMPEGAIRQKMMKEGFSLNEINEFFNYFLNNTNSNTNQKNSKNNEIQDKFLQDTRFASIIKLKNLKVPEIALRHRMKSDGFSQVEIDDFFVVQ